METKASLLKLHIILLLLFIGFSHQCPQNCQSCLSTTFCLQCSGYYTLFNNGTCSSCQCYVSGCLQCNCPDSNTCSICKEGYTYSDPNGCTPNTNSIDIKILIGLTIGGVISFIILMLIFVTIVRKKKKNNQTLQSCQNFKSSSNLKEMEVNYDSNKDFCTICLQNGCNMISSCDHYFHKQCFCEWIKIYGNCSICKNNSIEFILMICSICHKNIKKLSLIELFQDDGLQKCNQNHTQPSL